jgi:hypothetical protein
MLGSLPSLWLLDVFEWVEGTGLIGLRATKPRTARRGRRSGGRGMLGPCSLGLARAGRFLWVWRQMFFREGPWIGQWVESGQERDRRRPRVENLAGFPSPALNLPARDAESSLDSRSLRLRRSMPWHAKGLLRKKNPSLERQFAA